jgi:predicted nucleic-acid-binding Zn-ribbon protein
MKDGVCPKCGASEVYKQRNGLMSSHYIGVTLPNRWFGATREDIVAYVCANCAYLKLYVADGDTIRTMVQDMLWERVR